MIIDRFKSIFKRILRRKILLISILGGIIGGLLIFFLFVKQPGRVEIKTEEWSRAAVRYLVVDIPSGAFGRKKEIRIERVQGDTANAYRKLGPFISEFYFVRPSDNVDEFALKPLKFRYYFPAQYYYGPEYNNLALAYIPKSGDHYRVFPGSQIRKDDKGYYVEVSSFHTSVIGIVTKVPKKQELGISVIKEAPKSSAPAVLIVPGEDPTFKGEMHEIGVNFWEGVFPDRTIALYRYPLIDSRSLLYNQMYDEFKKSGKTSYVLFESERLYEELKKYDKYTFDVIAHGIGGLIVLTLLKNHPDVKSFRKIVLISTPVKGNNIVNPLFFGATFYNKDPKIVAEIFGIPERMAESASVFIFNYLEAVNTYYSDLLPDSEIVKGLRDLSFKKENLLLISGDVPPFDIDFSNTQLARFYPELTLGRGDGITKIDDFKDYPFKHETYHASFLDIYTKEEVLNRIKNFLSYTPPKFEGFKEDTYPEYLPVEVVEREGTGVKKEEKPKVVKIEKKEKLRKYELPEGYYSTEIFSEVGSMGFKSYFGGGILEGEPYFLTEEGLRSWNTLLMKGRGGFLKRLDDTISLILNGRRIFIDEIGVREGESVDLPDNVEDALIMKDRSLIATGGVEGISLYVLKGSTRRKLITVPGYFAKLVPVENGYLLITEQEIVYFEKDTLKERILKSAVEKDKYNVEFLDCLRINGEYYILTKDHYLIVYKDGEYQIIGEGWMGNDKMVKLGDNLVVLGDRSLIVLNMKNRKLPGKVQIFDKEIVDAFGEGKDLYIVFKEKDGFSLSLYRMR